LHPIVDLVNRFALQRSKLRQFLTNPSRLKSILCIKF